MGRSPPPPLGGDLALSSADLHTGSFFDVKMKTATGRHDRLLQLQELAKVLADSIDNCNDPKALPPLAKQYRETIREIEEIEGANHNGDEVSDILGERAADGKPGAVRKNRA